MSKIPITKPVLGEEELRLIQQVLESGWVVQGPFVKQFEDRFATFSGTQYAVATSSCTTALHIAVAALGLKPGDEVIVPAFTWISTANVVEYMGARPIFCDIDLQTFNIDVGQLESLVTSRTVGIIPVHLFGLCADMAAIGAFASRHHLWVVEDAACAFGARIDGRHAGTFGNAGCFSFHPRKAITTGEGGMITTNAPELNELSRSLRDHGASRSDLDRHKSKAAFALAEYNVLGYNFRMTDIQGALGCAQMDRAELIMRERSLRAARYDEILTGLDWLVPPKVPPQYTHGYQAYVCLFQPEAPTLKNVEGLHEGRNVIMQELEDEGISTRQGTHAAAMTGFYRDKYQLRREDFPMAVLAERLSLTLPLYPQMSESDQELVLERLTRAFHKG